MRATLSDLERELWLRRRNSGELKWTTRDGQEIPIKDMTDSHLQNAIRVVREIDEMNGIVAENYCEHEDAGDRI